MANTPLRIVAKSKEVILPALNSPPYFNITEDSYANFSPSQIDHLFDFAAGLIRITLDSIAPLKRSGRYPIVVINDSR